MTGAVKKPAWKPKDGINPTKKFNPKADKKTAVVFDSEARREHLSGFRKRREERKKRAKEETAKKIKDEHKAIKKEYKEQLEAQLPKIEDIFPKEMFQDTLNIIQRKSHTVEIEEINMGQVKTCIEAGTMNVCEKIRLHNQEKNITAALPSLKKALQMNCTKKTKFKRIMNKKRKFVKTKKK